MIEKPDVTCTECGTQINWLAVFPGNICLDCHAKHAAMPTAQELTAMWGGKLLN